MVMEHKYGYKKRDITQKDFQRNGYATNLQ